MIKFSKIFDFSNSRNELLRGAAIALFFAIFFCNNAYAVDEEFLKYCVGSVFDEKYTNADCWSCDIIKILLRAMMNLTNTIFKEIRELSVLILQLGGAIWLALYFMKSLSSLAAQDPAKVIDGALLFMFKWALIYAIIFAGLDVIMDYIVNPLLSIGLDVGMELAGASTISGL